MNERTTALLAHRDFYNENAWIWRWNTSVLEKSGKNEVLARFLDEMRQTREDVALLEHRILDGSSVYAVRFDVQPRGERNFSKSVGFLVNKTEVKTVFSWQDEWQEPKEDLDPEGKLRFARAFAAHVPDESFQEVNGLLVPSEKPTLKWLDPKIAA